MTVEPVAATASWVQRALRENILHRTERFGWVVESTPLVQVVSSTAGQPTHAMMSLSAIRARCRIVNRLRSAAGVRTMKPNSTRTAAVT